MRAITVGNGRGSTLAGADRWGPRGRLWVLALLASRSRLARPDGVLSLPPGGVNHTPDESTTRLQQGRRSAFCRTVRRVTIRIALLIQPYARSIRARFPACLPIFNGFCDCRGGPRNFESLSFCVSAKLPTTPTDFSALQVIAMPLILGIDAAWIEAGSSGVALIKLCSRPTASARQIRGVDRAARRCQPWIRWQARGHLTSLLGLLRLVHSQGRRSAVRDPVQRRPRRPVAILPGATLRARRRRREEIPV